MVESHINLIENTQKSQDLKEWSPDKYIEEETESELAAQAERQGPRLQPIARGRDDAAQASTHSFDSFGVDAASKQEKQAIDPLS